MVVPGRESGAPVAAVYPGNAMAVTGVNPGNAVVGAAVTVGAWALTVGGGMTGSFERAIARGA